MHEEFDLAGVPVFLDIVGKPKQPGRRGSGTPPGDKEASPVAPAPAKPAAKVVARPAPSASKPRIGKVRVSRGKAKPVKKAYTRWDKPRSLKGRAARQARK